MDFAVWVVQIALERCQVIFYDTGEYSFAQFKIPVISVNGVLINSGADVGTLISSGGGFSSMPGGIGDMSMMMGGSAGAENFSELMASPDGNMVSHFGPADPLPASHHARHIKGFRTDRDGIRGHCVLLHICDIAVYTGGKGQDQCNADDANGTSNRC